MLMLSALCLTIVMTDASLDLLAVLYAVPDTLNEGKQMIFFLHIKIVVLQHEIH